LLPKRRYPVLLAVAALVGALVICAVAVAAARTSHHRATRHDSNGEGSGSQGQNGGGYREVHHPRTPIRHVVVIFGENVSFDHYFGTYPKAANTDGPHFTAAPGTPAVNGLAPATDSSLPPSQRHSTNLLTNNPNSAQPQRLDSTATGTVSGPGQGQLTCDQNHNYSDEQKAFDNGLMDKFVESVGNAGGVGPTGAPCQAKQVMDYYDGNSVTGLWNYAQHYAMSDNSFATTFGPSSPGAINLASGNTGNVDTSHSANSPSLATPTAPNADLTANGKGGYSLTSDAQPYWDDCSTRDAVAMQGQNIGDSLNRAGMSWGWFQGGMRPTTSYTDALAATGQTGQGTQTFIPDQFKNAGFSVRPSSNQALCNSVHPVGAALGGTGQYGYKDDYIAHHEPFNYYASTANPHHLTVPADSSGQDTTAGLQQIGTDTQSYANGAPQFDTPNHQYDMSDFDQLMAAISAGRLPSSALPAVSFLKASGYQDGHAAYSDPADEQQFITREINALMKSPDWNSTAVFVNYDDSDGWYDHAYSGVTNASTSAADNLTPSNQSGPTSGKCTSSSSSSLNGEQGRCGFGPRVPMMLVSSYAKANAVDHNLSDQASIINFVEYNWGLHGLPGSADQILAGRNRAAGSPFDLAGLFSFSSRRDSAGNAPFLLDPSTGQPTG